MIEMQDANGLAKRVDHVVIAVGIETVAAIVAGGGNADSALDHLVHHRDPAPTRRAAAVPVLEIHIDRRQCHDGYVRFSQQVERPVDLTLALHRKAAAMATDDAALVAVRCRARVRSTGRSTCWLKR